MFTRLLVLGFFCIAVPAHAATLLSTNTTWKFLRGTNEASRPDITAWRLAGFNDAAFADAPAPFWYGDVRPGGTQLTDMLNGYTTFFLRKTIQVTDAASINILQLRYYVDDGFIMWINGQRVFSENIAETNPTTNSVAANQPIDPAVFTNQFNASIAGLLQEGANTVAVQVFNTSLASSDLGFDCELSSVVSETVAPTIASVSPAPNSSMASLTQVTVTFSESVQGVNQDDLLINTQPAASVSGGGTTYTFTFAQPLYGNVSFSWFPGHGIADEAIIPNAFDGTAAGALWQYTLLDNVPPTVIQLFPLSGSTVRALSEVEVRFSEEVNGVTASDLIINGQPATSVSRAPGGPYVFQFPAQPAGSANLQWAASHGIADQASVPNAFAGGAWSYTVDPNAVVGDLVINEIVAANISGLTDEFGDTEDWIEIYNRGTAAVNLEGWSLSDSPEEPSRWIFPAVAVPGGGYLIVYTSGKDRRNATGTNRLHTSFQLSASGEFLGLYNADSPRVLISGFSPTFPEQRNNTSYGIDASGNARYFGTPTPGAANGISTITGVVEPVHFSSTRGFYTQPFNLVLTCPTPGAQIRYTTDGSLPSLTNGVPYSNPIFINRRAHVRAGAFRTNLLPSVVSTHSYLYDFTAAQRTVPFINLVTATNNLIGRTGIIGMGGGGRSGDGAFITNNPATDFHNPSMHGIAWERPVSVEYILPEDNSGFQIDAGLRVQGSDWQRPRTTATSKFSFRLYFRGDYGSAQLNYPMFPLTSVEEFDQVVLRAGFNENANPFIRDEITRRLSHDMGQVAAHGSMALVLLNSAAYSNSGPVAVYNTTERVTKEFMQSQLGGGPEWDIVAPAFATSASGLGVIDGDRNDFANLMTNFWNGSAVRLITNQAAYERVSKRLNLANFADYALLNAFVAMGDWPANNWRAGRERTNGALWRYVAWDCEWAFGIYALAITRDSFGFSGTGTEDAGLNSVGNSEIARTWQALRVNPEFRLLVADRIRKHMFNGGALTGQNITNRYNQLRQMLTGYIPSMDTEILDWARDRGAIYLTQLNTYGLYGFSNAVNGVFASSNAPSFNQHGGTVTPDFSLTITAPIADSVIYYTTNGDDPRVMFTGAVSNSAAAYSAPIALNQSARIRARALWRGTNWSALTEADFSVASRGIALRVTELNYNPTNAAHEFIELQNVGSTPINLSGLFFEGITYTFNAGASIAPGARIVLASDFSPALFAARYPGVAVFGYYGGNLNNGGERITLKDGGGNIIFSVDYDDAGGWPTSPDGGGTSLEITDVFGDPDDPANWHASSTAGGSPGNANSSVATPVVQINEVLAENGGAVNNGGTFPDYVEIKNTGGTPVNLADWSLSDDGNARKFVFPSVEIPAGGFLVVWCDDTTNTSPGLHTGFSLQRGGDNVYLFDTATNRVDALSFGLQLAGHSVGRIAGDWILNSPTPGSENSAAATASASNLSINEWQASAPAGQSDWIELHNSAAQPVALRGCFLSTTAAVQRINSLSFVPASGFVQLFADEVAGPDHLDFKLPAVGTVISLYDTVAALVNTVTYTNATEGLTRGRLPDGAANIVNFPGSASPSATNYVNTYTGPVLNEVLARNVSAVTNAGSTADYVELFNTNAAPFSIAGMSLSVNSSSPGQFIFAPGTSVPGNGYLVIWCDASRPVSQFGGDLNTGRSLDGESGGVYLFNAQGQAVSTIEYGFQIADRPVGVAAGQWRLLSAATPGAANAATATLGTNSVLRFNEWMARPESGDDWFELHNSSASPVELSGLFLTDDPSMFGQGQHRIAALSYIAPGGFVQWIADGNAGAGRDHVNFSLDDDGDSLWLFRSATATNAVIDAVVFDAQPLATSEGRLPDGQLDIVAFPGSATPGESNYRPIAGVVINEILTHTDAPLEDSVELHNNSLAAINIGGWFLSDAQDNFKKFRIPDNTVIAPGGHLVFAESQFNAGGPTSFTFDSVRGDEAWLSAADPAGNLTGYRAGARFGAAENGVAFGRVVTSVGVDHAAASARTPGQANATPLVGPLVISEIMYNPTNGAAEYIEIQNVSGSSVPWARVDAAFPAVTNLLRLAGGIDYTFPIASPQSSGIAAGEQLVIVGFNPADVVARAAFVTHYNVPVNTRIFGPYSRSLGNEGDEITLLKPDTTQPPGSPDAGYVPYVVVDYVNYNDAAPWPSGAVDGGGLALSRTGGNLYGNEPLNWRAANPSPGAANGPGVATPPSITASPESQSALEGEATSLQVTATGTGPLSYQWRFNGVAVPRATNAAYVFDYVVLDDEGNYDCLVSNPGGASLSAAARVAVQVPVMILTSPVSVSSRPGSNIVFTVSARGSAPLRYQWRLNGIPLPGETSPTLVRNNVQFADDGVYDAVVSNPINSAIASARLTLLIAPVITFRPADMILTEGSTFTMSVEATGNPTPFSFSWRRNLGSLIIATNQGDYRANFVTMTTDAARLFLTNGITSTNYAMRIVVYNVVASNGVNAVFNVTVLADTDRDGIPNVMETNLGLDPNNAADGLLDLDGDGMSNSAEAIAGTNPGDAASYLRINENITPLAANLEFSATSNRTYTVQYTDSIASGQWSRLRDFVARTSNIVHTLSDPDWKTNRFYRVVTPRQ